jgi:hypothetical protein
MKSFSERKGLKPIKSVIQIDSMDDALRNGLWSALTIYDWDSAKPVHPLRMWDPSVVSLKYLDK